jgi:hypothetical protein
MRVAYVILLDFSCILEEVEQSTLTSELNNFEDNQNGRNFLRGGGSEEVGSSPSILLPPLKKQV